MALQDLGLLQYLPLRGKAIFIFVQKTTANVKVSCLLLHSLHTCKEHDKDWYIILAIEDSNLIYAGNSRGYTNALEFMKEDKTGKQITGTNTYTVEIIYIEGQKVTKKGSRILDLQI